MFPDITYDPETRPHPDLDGRVLVRQMRGASSASARRPLKHRKLARTSTTTTPEPRFRTRCPRETTSPISSRGAASSVPRAPSNRSLPESNRVSGADARILDFAEQRLAPEVRPRGGQTDKIPRQRLSPQRATRGNDAGFPKWRARRRETGLAGWASRIRTSKCHSAKRPLKCRANWA
jgi:hypothetical protein